MVEFSNWLGKKDAKSRLSLVEKNYLCDWILGGEQYFVAQGW